MSILFSMIIKCRAFQTIRYKGKINGNFLVFIFCETTCFFLWWTFTKRANYLVPNDSEQLNLIFIPCFMFWFKFYTESFKHWNGLLSKTKIRVTPDVKFYLPSSVVLSFQRSMLSDQAQVSLPQKAGYLSGMNTSRSYRTPESYKTTKNFLHKLFILLYHVLC